MRSLAVLGILARFGSGRGLGILGRFGIILGGLCVLGKGIVRVRA